MEIHSTAATLKLLKLHLRVAIVPFTLFYTVVFAQMTIPPGGLITIAPQSTLNLSCAPINVLGSFDINSGMINSAGGISIASGGTIIGGTGTIINGGNWSNNGSFNAGNSTIIFDGSCNSGQISIDGNTIYNNLIITSTTGNTFAIDSNSTITVNAVLRLQGSDSQAVNLVSSSSRPAMVFLGPQALVEKNDYNLNNVQFASAQSIPIPALNKFAKNILIMTITIASFYMISRHYRRQKIVN